MKKILLVDLWNVFMIQWHAGVNKDARFPFDTTMGRVRTLAQDYDHVAIMTDGGKSFRRDLDSRWKKNREEKYAGAVMMLAEVERALSENFHVFKVEHLEADDLIASCVHQLRQTDEWPEGEYEVTINSADKDLLGLLEPSVQILSTNTGKIKRGEDLRPDPKFGVDPPKMRDFLVLSDDHNGVKYFGGIGPIHAARLLNQFGDLASIIGNVDAADPADTKKFLVTPPSIRESIKTALRSTVDGRPLIDVAVEMVTLRTDAPCDFMTIFQPLAPPETISMPYEERDEVSDPDQAGGKRGREPDPQHHRSRRGDAVDGQQSIVQSTSESRASSEDNQGQRDAGPSGSTGRAEIIQAPRDEIVVPASRWELSLEPQTPKQAGALAQSAWKAGFWPKHGSADGCLLIILAGRAKGIPAFDALNGMHIIDGKPTFGAHLIIGMVRASKACSYLDLVESDDKHALWITKRKKSKSEQKSLYTIEMATQAELYRPTRDGKKSNWQKNPQDMLVKTAGAKLCRWVYQDVTGGFVATEEMEDQ